MSSGCGTYASSSLMEGDIDYSHRLNVGADDIIIFEKQWMYEFHMTRLVYWCR